MPSCLRLLATTTLILSMPSLAAGSDYFQITELAPDLLMLSTDQGNYSNNSLVFTGPDGLLLVDTHHGKDANAFKQFVENLGMGKPKYIINTHRHVEHIGGNHLFGKSPIVVTHHLFPEKLRSGTFLFSEYPAETFPDIVVSDSLDIEFNNELIQVTNIGGSHDDNELMVHFSKHKIAHISSVVNGFNFPSVDSAGDVLKFEPITRRLMELLPRDVGLVSGHNGKTNGYDFIGSWDQLPAYANMMKETVNIVRRELDSGTSQEEMETAEIFSAYEKYAGSYVSGKRWINYVVDALTIPREARKDICKPVYEVWKEDGASAAVGQYQQLLLTGEDQYDFSEHTLLGIGSKLYGAEKYADAATFLAASTKVYPDSEYGYYSHYLAASALQKLNDIEKAIAHAQESVNLNENFEAAATLLAELSGNSAEIE